MHAMDARRFAGGVPLEAGATCVVTAVVITGFVALTIRRLQRMDNP